MTDEERDHFISHMIILVVVVGFVVLWVGSSYRRMLVSHSAPTTTTLGVSYRATEEVVDVSALSIAIDSRSRTQIQEHLAELQASLEDNANRAVLARFLRQAANALKEHRVAWLYAGGKDSPPLAPMLAQRRFNELVADLRSRYRHEVGPDGTSVTVKPRPEEGEGLVVVSLVVAARGDLLGLLSATDANAVSFHLDRLGNAGMELRAFEVIWSPSVDGDRMSSAELEVLYPEMQKLDETSLAGRVFCGHCRAPYAGELASCPHCGAPRGAV